MKHHYIEGQWIQGKGQAFDSINPANGRVIWEGRYATEEELKKATHAAHRAAPLWAALSFSDRARILQTFATLVESKGKELAQLISEETGKPLWEAVTEVTSVVSKIAISIQSYHERTQDKQVAIPDGTSHLRYKPHGVVAVLGPFNFPAHLSNGHIVPALLAGNTVVYKPSELTPAVAEFIMQCWHQSGLPAGVINCLQGDAKTAKLLLQQDLQGIYFTGSYQAGVQIHKSFAGRPEVILALEMGGNNPLIIGEVHHQDAALYHTLVSTLITTGQRCTCARRVFIPDSTQGDTFLNQLISACQSLRIGAYLLQPEPFMGPVISHQQALFLLDTQKNLQQSGGESLLIMSLITKDTGFLTPGIIDMTPVTHPIDEEIFGPLIQIYRYHHFEEALTQANQTRFGLAAGLLSDNPAHYQLFYQTMRAGLIHWNRPTTGAQSNLPFGGIGHSGNHRPSAFFAADYCAYPIASLEQPQLALPEHPLPGLLSLRIPHHDAR
ncbi:MAG: succinylglutamate-semialdehyde dehydrogenase [Legionellales bacterium]|nr:succinylglutamate-semialdehyde dehydrogenase [Legionellales bacterium]